MFKGDTLVLLTGTDVDRAALRFAATRAWEDGVRIHVIRVHGDPAACRLAAFPQYRFQGAGASLHPHHEIADTLAYAREVLAGMRIAGLIVEAARVTDLDPARIEAFVHRAGIGVIVAARACGQRCDGEVCQGVRHAPVPVLSLPLQA
jgi:hypothetical protein